MTNWLCAKYSYTGIITKSRWRIRESWLWDLLVQCIDPVKLGECEYLLKYESVSGCDFIQINMYKHIRRKSKTNLPTIYSFSFNFNMLLHRYAVSILSWFYSYWFNSLNEQKWPWFHSSSLLFIHITNMYWVLNVRHCSRWLEYISEQNWLSDFLWLIF